MQPSLFDNPPCQRHSDTSRAAAEAILPKAAALRRRVYDVIRHCSDVGCTDEYGQQVTGLNGNTYRPRRRELEQAGLVADSGKRRKTASGRMAVVWVTTNDKEPTE